MLARIQKAMKEKDEGFTLIELLVVIIIIGILAAIAIPVFLNQRNKATEASVKSDLRTVANQMETYFVDKQTYPAATSAEPGKIVIAGTEVALSKNNVAIAGETTAGTFCVGVMNTDLGNDSARYYDSSKGGLQPKGGTCGTPAPAPTN